MKSVTGFLVFVVVFTGSGFAVNLCYTRSLCLSPGRGLIFACELCAVVTSKAELHS